MKYYLKALQNYAEFTGRASRSEYWYFVLFNVIIGFIVDYFTAMAGSPSLSYIYTLAVLLPGIAVCVRRMHDIDRSGWFMLIPFYNLYLACLRGTDGDNGYGPDPLGSTPEFEFDQEQQPTTL